MVVQTPYEGEYVSENTDNEERREFVRTDSNLRFSMIPIHGDIELQDAITDIMSEPPEGSMEWFDIEIDPVQRRIIESVHQLSYAIEELGNKIDHLVDKTEGRKTKTEKALRLPMIELSGGGFRFRTSDPPAESSLHWVCIEFSRFPLVTARCIARAAWVRPLPKPAPSRVSGQPAATHDVGMAIQYIRESDRERIIHAVFRYQRESLRARKQQQS